MKIFVNMLLITLIACLACPTLPAQDLGAAPGLVVTPTSITIPSGGIGSAVLQSKILTAQKWKVVLPLPTCVGVTPLEGQIPGNGAIKLALKAVGKPGERGVINFSTDRGQTLTLSVIIGTASDADAGVAPIWSLVPSEGVTTGKPITVQLKNDAQTTLKWKVGILPSGVTVTPMYGMVPATASFAVNITGKLDVAGSMTRVVKIPFISGTTTKMFVLTIQPPTTSSPTDIQPR